MISYIIYNNIDIIIAIPIAALFIFSLYMGLKECKSKDNFIKTKKNNSIDDEDNIN